MQRYLEVAGFMSGWFFESFRIFTLLQNLSILLTLLRSIFASVRLLLSLTFVRFASSLSHFEKRLRDCEVCNTKEFNLHSVLDERLTRAFPRSASILFMRNRSHFPNLWEIVVTRFISCLYCHRAKQRPFADSFIVNATVLPLPLYTSIYKYWQKRINVIQLS